MFLLGKRSHANLGFAAVSFTVLASTSGGCSLGAEGTAKPDERVMPQVDETDSSTGPIEPGSWPVLEDGGVDAGVVVTETDAGETIPKVSDACGLAAQRWLAIAETNCVACHGRRSSAKGGFFTVLDVDQLIASGKVVPNNPDGSPLYLKLSSGAMPPPERTQRPSPEDIESVRAWIACGAPKAAPPVCERDCTTFVDISTRLSLFVNDVQAFPTPEERLDVRYLDLTGLANAGQGAQRLELYRDAMSYLVNSLSTKPNIVVPQPIDGQNLLFRIRLSDYGWSADTWERIVAAYPYGVNYDPNSRNFPVDEAPAERLRVETGTSTPYLQADWFLAHAVRPPLYYDILGIPGQLGQLEQALGIDIQANIAERRVLRTGFKVSGPSHYNRVIERHSLGERGALWITYDFDSGVGTSNVIIHPLDFQWASNELFFNLPNGLQAYMITDANGTRLDKAPNDAVQDPKARDLAIENGISCISCHTDKGVLVQSDEVRAATLLTSVSSAEIDVIQALYADEATSNAVFAEDQARYTKAARATRVHEFVNGSVHVLDGAHVGLLSLKDVAGVLGVESAKLAAQIDLTPRLFPPEFQALRAVDARLPRESFDLLFDDLASALGLGQARPR